MWTPIPLPENFKWAFLKCDAVELNDKFHTKSISLHDFDKEYVLEIGLYPSLTNNAKEIASIFGSTYACEQ